MSTNRSLITLLRALRSHAEAEDVQRLLDSATTLLILLANPLNVTLLTSQLLSAPSIWARPDGLHTTLHILSVFSNAAKHLGHREPTSSNPTPQTLPRDKWTLAIIRGADENSPRWRHLCALVGLLVGSGDSLSPSLRDILENAVVKAANLALHEEYSRNAQCGGSIVLTLTHAFDLISNAEKAMLEHSLLLRAISNALLSSKDGFHSGYILSTMDTDVVQSGTALFDWSHQSSTYIQFERIAHSPLMSCLGSLARMAASSVDMVRGNDAVAGLLNDLLLFSRSLLIQWQQNKLSELDTSEESEHLTDGSLRVTIPRLWHTLRSLHYAITIVLRSILMRTLRDPSSPQHSAPTLALTVLHVLRNMFFVTSKAALESSSQYQFVFLTCIDILAQSPTRAEALLEEIKPKFGAIMPTHPLDRCQDLFFLNTAEQLAANLSPTFCEKRLINAATPYLIVNGDTRLRVHCEAAHSVMLAVLALPNNSELLQRHLLPYLEALLSAFPGSLSPRQFRLGIKSLVKRTAPPSSSFVEDPFLPSVVLEIVRGRLGMASSQPFDLSHDTRQSYDANDESSEQSTLLLSIIDSLPFLPTTQLEPWLDLVSLAMTRLRDSRQSDFCRQRLWQVLSSGDLDVDRASLSVSWWTSRGWERIFGAPTTEREVAIANDTVAVANQT